MNEVDSAFDVVTAVLALVMLIGVCMWSLNTMRSASASEVDERTVVTNVYGEAAQAPTLTAVDTLLMLVVNDAYVPYPATARYSQGSEQVTITYDAAYFSNRDETINNAWASFFETRMAENVTSMELDRSGSYWAITLGG